MLPSAFHSENTASDSHAHIIVASSLHCGTESNFGISAQLSAIFSSPYAKSRHAVTAGELSDCQNPRSFEGKSVIN
jgi:hypothetical protein